MASSVPNLQPPERWRLFAAAPVPDAAASELWAKLEPLVTRYPDARWARREQFHATLVFLGQTDPGDVPRLAEAMALVALQHRPPRVVTSGAGGRIGDRRGGVAWLRLDDSRRRLGNLARELDWRFGSGVYKEGRPRPHVTVARRIDDALLTDLQAIAAEVQTGWTFDRIGLYRSHADLGGSRYEALAENVLTGEASPS